MRVWFLRTLLALVAMGDALLVRADEPPGLDLDAEVPASPKVVTGRLHNGLRYAVLRHTAKPGQISLRLLVEAGSVHENDDESGYAHFVEHMAFNGTRHYRSGELVKTLQRLGVQFGPHLGAETGYVTTRYRLDLTGGEGQLPTALEVLHDFADGVLFSPAEVKRERGVILSEDIFRQTPEMARYFAHNALLFANTLLPERDPIGTQPVIEAATPERLRAFYDTWYRPERLSLIVVGDLDPARTVEQLRTQFSALTARAPARPEPVLGPLPVRDRVAVALHRESTAAGVVFRIGLVWNRPTGPGRWRDALVNSRTEAAMRMVGRRLDELVRAPGSAFGGAAIGISTPLPGIRQLLITATASSSRWPEALTAVERELRRAREHGFTPEELDTHKRTALNELARSSEFSAAATPEQIASEIAASLSEEHQYVIVAEQREHFAALLESLTPDDCLSVYRDVLARGALSVFVVATADNLPSDTRIRKVLAESSAQPVSAPQGREPVRFAYTDFGPAGAIVRKEHVTDLDLWLVEFANGVRLNLKRTTVEPNRVYCSVRLGEGRRAEPADLPGIGYWTISWPFGGLVRQSTPDIRRLIDDNGLVFGSGCDSRSFFSNGDCRPEQLDLELGLLAAYVADPAFRPEAHEQVDTSLRSQLGPIWNSSAGPVQQLIIPRLAGGDPRVGLPPQNVVFTRTHAEVKNWLAPLIASGRPEIALVGDCDIDTAIAAVARTFGALPPRNQIPATPEPQLSFPKPPVAEVINFDGDAIRTAYIESFWPVHDTLDSRRRQQLGLLAAIFTDRIRVQIREKNGGAFSYRASFEEERTFPGLAHLHCSLDAKPAEAIRHGDATRDIAAELARRGIKKDELARAQQQAVANLRARRETNAYWLDEVLALAQADPTALAAARTAEADITAATKTDLDALAARYLKPESDFRFIIMPKPEASVPAKP